MDPVWKESSAWRDTEYAGGRRRGAEGGGGLSYRLFLKV